MFHSYKNSKKALLTTFGISGSLLYIHHCSKDNAIFWQAIPIAGGSAYLFNHSLENNIQAQMIDNNIKASEKLTKMEPKKTSLKS